MREPAIVTGEYYHVFNRGVKKEPIFEDHNDFRRFYQSLYLFNNANFERPGRREIDRETILAAHEAYLYDRDPYVKILSFCLIPNHFHLMIQQVKEGGAAKFFHKLLKGFAQYFNRRHGQSGHVFEGAYEAVHIANEAHFIHVPRYIHLNALDMTNLDWRNGKIADWQAADTYLDSYQWSSHSLYKSGNQELPVVDEETASQFFKNSNEYKKFLKSWSGRYLL